MNATSGINIPDGSVMNSTDELSEDIVIASNRGDNLHGKIILEQDRFLPIANISRLIKRAIPPGGKVSRDAKECIQECASEFISFITSEASERCTEERRKTITAEDILTSMKALAFDSYMDPLNAYLKKYREANRVDRVPLPSLKNSMVSEDSVTTVTIESESRNEDSQLLLTVPEEGAPQQQVQVINLESVPLGGDFSTPVIIPADNGNEENSVTRLLTSGNVQHLDLLVDPNSGQHYISLQLNDGSRQVVPAQIPSVATIDSSHITSEVGPSAAHGTTDNSLNTQCELRSQFALNVNESHLTNHDADLHRPTIFQFDQAQYISQHNFTEPSQEVRRVVEVQSENLQRSSTPQYAQLDRVPTQCTSQIQTVSSRKRPSSNSSHMDIYTGRAVFEPGDDLA